jgi:integrase
VRRAGPPNGRARRGSRASGAAGAALIGAEGLHFHDLRHTGNHFAASSGAGCGISWHGWATTASVPR